MGITAGDYDNDGDEDVFVVNLTREGATLYRNEGGHFADTSMPARLGPATFPYTGFGTEWFDYDNDGFLDLFVANGAVTIIESQRGSSYPFEQRNLLLRNTGSSFEDISGRAGAAFAFEEVSRGAAFGDIDNDGDVDIVVTNNNGPVRLLLNDVGSRRDWLCIQLKGTKSNRMGLGARVALYRKGAPVLWRRVHTDSSYLSANDPRLHFGLGDANTIERVEVYWPDGSKETWTGLQPNRLTTLVQGTGQ
jgi:hypothetical protein